MNKDIAEALGDISKIACLINLQGKHSVFVDDSGHVKQLAVDLHLGGWKSGRDADLRECVYYDNRHGNSLKKLREVKDVLHKIYKNGKINMENCNYEIEETKHYKFC